MTRRKLVALVAAIVLVSIGLVVVGTGLFLTRTDYGRAKVRDVALPLLQRQFPNAKIYVGKVSGSVIGGIVIDSIAVRDMRGELFASTGRVTLEYNWRDLFDYRVFVNRATVEHPYVHIIQHANGRWNFKEIFASNKPAQPQQPKLADTRGWGDYIVFDSVTARNTTFILTMAWTPDEPPGRVRDSVIKAHLTNPAKSVSRVYDGYARNYVWTNGSGLISHIRLSDPDSNQIGKEFKIASLSVDEFNPTFKFRKLRGDVRVLGDSVWLDIPHFELQASFGHGRGKVWWGSDLPVRYDIAVRGDSVSLDDVNWVYPTLPREGGGTVNLAIKNDSSNLHVVDFRLQNMDMRTTGSHLTGDMWFGTGAPELLIRHVNLKADPVTFDFIRTLNGKPFPYDWKGDIFGTVRARGGTQRHFVVDDARGTFQDAHVKGAVSRFAGNGELDILNPAFTTFHHFNVDAQAIDLRTIEFLNKNFPRLGGIVYGTATLDSVWLDVRFSNASLFHQDGPGEPSHVTGEGRVTTATVMEYDLSLTAEPLNATMLARSKPFEALPIRGLFSGPLRVRGTAPDLAIATSLQSAAGSFSFDGRADVDSIGGYGARGHGEFSSLNLGGLLEKPDIPVGLLSGHYDVDLDSLDITPSSMRGTAEVSLDRTVVDSIRVRPSTLRLRFADGKMILDSATIRTDAFTADLRGAVGLPQGSPDSLRFDIIADSLGGLRPLFPRPATVPGLPAAEPDSLSGSLRVRGLATGTLDALHLSGTLNGGSLVVNQQRADTVVAAFDLRDALTPDRTGTITASADSLTLASVLLDTASVRLDLRDSTHFPFSLRVVSHNGPTATTGGTWTDSAARQQINLDSLRLAIGDSRWALSSPARIVIDSNATRVDSLLIHNLDSGFVSIMASVPGAGNAFAQLRAHAVPLKDVGVIAQLSDSLQGTADLALTATGTRAQPVISATAKLSALELRRPSDTTSTVRVDSITAIGAYSRQRVIADLAAIRNGTAMATAHASWPVDITLFSMQQRNDSVDARITAPSLDLALITQFLLASTKTSVTDVSGTLSGFAAVGGTTAAKIYTDSIRIANGALTVPAGGVSFTNINGAISGAVGVSGLDSNHIAITAHSSDHDTVAVTGFVQNLARLHKQDPNFNLTLTADSIHIYNRRTVADVYFSTPEPLHWVGTTKSSVLTGQITIDRGAIFLSDPDLARKLAVETIAENTGTRTETSALVTDLMNGLVIQSVPVTLGEDVRLRSSEADVRLSGQLELVKSNTSTRLITPGGEFVPGLTLNGSLTTTGGTYTLRFTQAVQRQFNVLAGGLVTFDGSSPETPLVDIKAQYTVRRPRDRDLNVIVNLTGRLPTPVATFSSDNDYSLDQSDLLSYLVIGQPGFDFTNSGLALGGFISPTVSALIADKLRNTALGSFGASFQLELGQYDTQNSSTTTNAFQSYLRGSTLDFGVPVYKNVFLGVNAGYCLFANRQVSALGANIEYRFRPDMSFQAAYDPAQIDTRSSCNATFAGLVPSVAQFSFAIRKTWRF
jgi:translocation and assembly module TamB